MERLFQWLTDISREKMKHITQTEILSSFIMVKFYPRHRHLSLLPDETKRETIALTTQIMIFDDF